MINNLKHSSLKLAIAVSIVLLGSSVGLASCQSSSPAASVTTTAQVDNTPDSNLPREANGQSAELLSAFFGLDNNLPRRANAGICRDAGGADGMPVIFSHEIDFNTLQAGDFRVLTNSGRSGSLSCVTLLPAIDPGELRTVLLVGDYGSAGKDPPISVEIVGNLHAIDGTVNFKGASVEVTPLALGPTLILAENLPENEWQLDRESNGRADSSSGCLSERVQQVVRVTWAGGITTPENEEPGDNEREQYRVTVQQPDGLTRDVVPLALGDLGDGDNNHELCLDTRHTPIAVSFPAGYLIDPNQDLNPATTVEIKP